MKWTLLLFALLISPAQAQLAGGLIFPGPGIPASNSGAPTTTPIPAGAQSSLSITVLNSLPIVGGIGTGIASAANRDVPIPISGAISNLSVNFPSGVGAGTYAMAVTVNGSSTSAPACTVSVNSCSDASHPIAVSAGNTVGLSSTPSSSPTLNANTQWATTFVSTNNNETFLAGGASAPSTSVNNWASIQGWSSWLTTNDVIVSNVMPAAGVIDQLYVIGSAAPGVAKSYVLTIFQNGVAAGSPGNLTCTLTGSGSGAGITTCNDLTDAITVAAGDTISIQSSPSGTPASNVIRWGVRLKPTVANQSWMLMTASSIPGTSATVFGYPTGYGTGATEANVEGLSPTFSGGFSITSMFVAFSAAPTAGTRTVTLMNPAGTPSANMTCALSASATSVCGGATPVTGIGASSATLLDWKHVSVAATTTTSYKLGAVMTVP